MTDLKLQDYQNRKLYIMADNKLIYSYWVLEYDGAYLALFVNSIPKKYWMTHLN